MFSGFKTITKIVTYFNSALYSFPKKVPFEDVDCFFSPL